jgi:hypothetical protein
MFTFVPGAVEVAFEPIDEPSPPAARATALIDFSAARRSPG